MGAFDALLSIRTQILQSAELDILKIIEIIRNLDSDASGLDFEAALVLHEIVNPDASLDVPQHFYRGCIYNLILSQKMTWARSITLGRDKLLKQLSRDEHQCFRSASLLELPPSDDVVEWWDSLAAQMRLYNDQNKLERARQAEKLSLEYEIARIAQLGIAMSPRWIIPSEKADARAAPLLSEQKELERAAVAGLIGTDPFLLQHCPPLLFEKEPSPSHPPHQFARCFYLNAIISLTLPDCI